MAVVIRNNQERQLIKTDRVGLGLLEAMFAESYCSHMADRIELISKLSTTATLLASSSAAVAVFQASNPQAPKYLSVASAIVSAVVTAFAWRSRATAFAEASRGYGNLAIDWNDLWDQVRNNQAVDPAKIKELERKSIDIGKGTQPHRMRLRLARRCQQLIRTELAL